MCGLGLVVVSGHLILIMSTDRFRRHFLAGLLLYGGRYSLDFDVIRCISLRCWSLLLELSRFSFYFFCSLITQWFDCLFQLANVLEIDLQLVKVCNCVYCTNDLHHIDVNPQIKLHFVLFFFTFYLYTSVLWHWLAHRKGVQPVKNPAKAVLCRYSLTWTNLQKTG